jgi:hypothetical protein
LFLTRNGKKPRASAALIVRPEASSRHVFPDRVPGSFFLPARAWPGTALNRIVPGEVSAKTGGYRQHPENWVGRFVEDKGLAEEGAGIGRQRAQVGAVGVGQGRQIGGAPRCPILAKSHFVRAILMKRICRSGG